MVISQKDVDKEYWDYMLKKIKAKFKVEDATMTEPHFIITDGEDYADSSFMAKKMIEMISQADQAKEYSVQYKKIQSKKKKVDVLPNPRSSFGKMIKEKLDKLNNKLCP